MIHPLPTRIHVCCLLLAASFFGVATSAAELPNLALPAGVGVNIHFTRGHGHDLDLIAAAGFKFIRMDFVWSETEPKKGTYDWSAYDALTANLESRGLRAYYILDYSNPLYEETVTGKDPISGQETKTLSSPQHPDSVAAFARWEAAAAKHFSGRHVIWEIWNEPDGSFWQPKADVQQYTTLALATARAVRAADPSATILAPATSGFPWPFLETFLSSGVLEYLDGVSVHPYRAPNQPPETALADYHRLRELIATHAPPARRNFIPIISGEWGYSSNTKGVSPERQAQFMVRQQLFNLLNGLPISIWYDWKNDGNDPNENEHNFGTVSPELAPKPVYTAIKTLTHELAGFGIANRYPAASTNDFILVLTNAAGAAKLAAWTLDDPHPLRLQLHPSISNAIPRVNGVGRESQIEVRNGRLILDLNEVPQFITLGQARLD